MYPIDLYFEIASLRGQALRDEAAHERLLRQTSQPERGTRTDPGRDAGYRRLAIAVLGLGINTLTLNLQRQRPSLSSHSSRQVRISTSVSPHELDGPRPRPR
jgi:hypothetical protein